MKKIKIRPEIAFIGIFSLIIGIFFCKRIILGADTTDESFYAAMAYRLAQGNSLFSDMWEQVSTSSVIGGALMWVYKTIFRRGTEGCILFFRIAYFVINMLAASLLYKSVNKIVKKEYAVLLSLFYLTYAPFHIYSFGYNNLADMFFGVTISFWMLAYIQKNNKYFIIAGIFCAILAFTYPTMIVMCLVMFLLILARSREYGKKSWLYFCLGGFAAAAVIGAILCITVGINGVLSGIQGILSDPAYSITEIKWSEKLQKAVEYFFYPLKKDGLYINFFTVWLFVLAVLLFVLAFFKNRYKWLKFTIALYPVIVLLEMQPPASMEGYAMGNYMFFLSFTAPFLVGFTDKYRKTVLNLLYIQWLPSVFFYLIIGSSSFGGALQGSQCLYLAAIVTLTEIVLILKETAESFGGTKVKYATIATLAVLSLSVIFELQVFYSVVYRDGSWKSLTKEITVGPYKGIRTTEAKKEYLEDLYHTMQNMEEKGKTVCILYHSNFAYLYLDMIPETPTVWGLYPRFHNQDVFLKYFNEKDSHIPEIIFVVDVDDDVDLDLQDEEYYAYAEQLKAFISDNYSLAQEEVVRKTGKVKKYKLTKEKSSALD